MAKRLHADVVVVGAGPVGLTLAMDLAWRGVDVIVAETRRRGRAAERQVQPRLGALDGDLPPARRRAEGARRRPAAGLSRTTWSTAPRRPAPSWRASRSRARAERYTANGRPGHLVADAGAAAPHQPDLPRADAVRASPALPGVRILNRTQLDDFTQDAQGSVAALRRPRHGEPIDIACRYPGRLRRRPLAGAPADRRDTVAARRSCSACSRPTSARRKLLGMLPAGSLPGCIFVAQSAPLRHRLSRSTAARPG